MIRHEVILRVTPDENRETIEHNVRDVVDLLTSIPGVETVRYGISNSPAYRHVMIVVELANELALHRFGRHPQHTRAVRIIARLADSYAVGSYLVGSERRQG